MCLQGKLMRFSGGCSARNRLGTRVFALGDNHGVDGAIAVYIGTINAGFIGENHVGNQQGVVARGKPRCFMPL